MLFQYNPLIHHLEITPRREIVCTVSRLDLLAPRVRYNVHDQGGIMGYGTMRGLVRGFGYAIEEPGSAPETAGPRGSLPWTRPIPLPFLWVYGRADATISVMGANIYPEDVETVIYRDPELTRRVHSFQLSVLTDATGTPRPGIALELTDDEGVDDTWRESAADRLRAGLFELNNDYRASSAEFPAAMVPVVETYGLGNGPFAGDALRIKQRHIAAG